MDSTLMIETRNLTKTFGDFTAVDGANISVRQGVIHGFVGPNGAGKTTTMKMLIGAIWRSRGEGYIKGHVIGSSSAKQVIGYAPEQAFFYSDMVASDYLEYMARICGIERVEARKRALELLDWLNIGDFAESKVGGFSAGMKQRVCLAQALIHEPELLILDEPTANMDPTGRISILDNLRTLCHEKNITIFLSSHILSELEQVVDYLTMIDRGQIVVEGEMSELRKSFSGNLFLLKTSNNEKILEILRDKGLFSEGWIDDANYIHVISDKTTELRKEVVGALTQADIELEHFSEERASLQDIYQKTMGMEEEE